MFGTDNLQPPITVTVHVKDGDKVIETRTFDTGGKSPVTFQVTLSGNELPVRSPLHPEALNFDDMMLCRKIKKCNVTSPSYDREAYVISEPFRHGSKYGWYDSRGQEWMISVVTMNNSNQIIKQDWFLSEMGVTPCGEGDRRYWDDQKYTVAAQ